MDWGLQVWTICLAIVLKGLKASPCLKIDMQACYLDERGQRELLSKWRDDRGSLYDRVLHSPVDGDLYMIIPRGRKCSLWFTSYKGGPSCFVVELDRKNRPSQFINVACSFQRELAFDTLVSGVMTEAGGSPIFCALLVQVWKGRAMPRALDRQIDALESFMLSIQNDSRLPVLPIGVPAMCTSKGEIASLVDKSLVPVHGIRVASTERNALLGVYRVTASEHPTCVMLVRPEVEEDVYSLWSDKKIGYALVPDYKTSVMLNGIFRNVVENNNLDALEESDDEDEFENIAEDKFIVNPEGKSMEMRRDPKFGGWIPVKIVDSPPTPLSKLRALHDTNNSGPCDLRSLLKPCRSRESIGGHRSKEARRKPFRNQPSKRCRGYLGFD